GLRRHLFSSEYWRVLRWLNPRPISGNRSKPTFRRQGNSLRITGATWLAAGELQAVVALDPKNADARNNLGVLLFFSGDCAQAVPQLRAAVTLLPALANTQA